MGKKGGNLNNQVAVVHWLSCTGVTAAVRAPVYRIQ